MSTQESESALDAIVQQTWKRARTSQEIGAFLNRHFAAIEEQMTVDDDHSDIDALARDTRDSYELAA